VTHKFFYTVNLSVRGASLHPMFFSQWDKYPHTVKVTLFYIVLNSGKETSSTVCNDSKRASSTQLQDFEFY